ncbi:MAG: transposase family protein [Clostridia bacterium]|nr:transposase family protein [Deltaproteobacteria bacterium]
MLPLWVKGYERRYNGLDTDVREALLRASASSLKRLLEPVRRKYTLRGRATAKPGAMLRNTIPIATGQWEQTKPGFIEADTVAHCGGSMAGQFAYTLDCVDLATGWTEQRAVWAKRDSDVVAQMRLIERALPFPMLGFDSDNGSEFMNQKMLAFLIDRQKPVQFTRSRAYCKNDNAHIEQKNWTHVRQMIGYERFDDPAIIADLNNLYANEWRLYHNFFGASVKLIAKKRVGSKTVKTYDAPQTPYQRVLTSEHVSDYAKEGLRRIFEKLDPFVLKDASNAKIKALFR